MADSKFGINCIALCASLSEVHGDHAAAWILEDIWKLYRHPRQYCSSHSQFLMLVKACSGVLAKTAFAETVDRMLGQDLSIHPDIGTIDIGSGSDIAKALVGLIRISKKEVTRIAITGGYECAFIAALARWLFNFEVFVEGPGGLIIYQDTTCELAQVHVSYFHDHGRLSLVKVTDTTFVIRDFNEYTIRDSEKDAQYLSIRTPWNGCLARVFGVEVNKLLGLSLHFGAYLGSVARVYRGLAMGEMNVAEISREQFSHFGPACYGLGFIESAFSNFPELSTSQNLLREMQLAESASFQDALRTIDKTMHCLVDICECESCPLSKQRQSIRPADPSLSCLLVVAMSIRHLIVTLGSVTAKPEILPSIRDISSFYHMMARDLGDRKSLNETMFLSAVLGLCFDGQGRDFASRDYQRRGLLSDAMELFSGYTNQGNDLYTSSFTNKTAAVHRGFCYHLGCLLLLNTQAEVMKMVHILPGHIQVDDTRIEAVVDEAEGYDDIRNENIPELQYTILGETDLVTRIILPQQNRMVVEAIGLTRAEDFHLSFFYNVTTSEGTKLSIRPGLFTQNLSDRTGVVACGHLLETEGQRRLAFSCAIVREGWNASRKLYDEVIAASESRFPCYVWSQRSEISRCVALALLGRDASRVFVQRDECLSCCTKTISRAFSKAQYRTDIGYHIG